MQELDFFKLALEASKTGIWDWHPQSNELTWSDRIREIFAIPPEVEVTMDTYRERIHPDDRDMVQQKIQQALDPNFTGTYHIEHRIIVNGNEVRWIDGVGKVFFDQHNKPVRFIGTATDVTERKLYELERAELLGREKQAREEAQFEKRKFEALFMKAPVPIAVMQAHDLVFILANEPYRKLAGATHEIVGLTLFEVFPSRDPVAEQQFYDVIRTGKRFVAQEQPISIDWLQNGQITKKYFDIIYEPIIGGDSQVDLVMMLSVDVTNQVVHRRQMEKNEAQTRAMNKELKRAKILADEANTAKTLFLANVSHEIRTPLGIIMGFTELALAQLKSSENLERYLQSIQRNGQLLNQIIGEVLDLSKIEARCLETEQIRVELKDLLQETVSLLDLKAREKSITLTLIMDKNLPDFIETDPTRLRQIIMNLVGNSIKFTNKGKVNVIVRWTPQSQLELTIQDTGIGISPEQQNKLFQPFSQADNSMTRSYGGTGLGLVLSQQLAQALGGNLYLAKSELNVGSTFVCTVKPAHPEWVSKSMRAPMPNQDSARDAQNAISLAGLKILIVEDSEDNRFLITHFLKDSGAKIEEAENGLEAIEKAEKTFYDAILMDLQMPVMDGHEATIKLRSNRFTGPIIALTAHAMQEERDKALKEGFTAYLTKPLDSQLLLATIDRTVKAESRKNFDQLQPDPSLG